MFITWTRGDGVIGTCKGKVSTCWSINFGSCETCRSGDKAIGASNET